MKLRLWKIKCAGWPRLLLGEPRWEGGRGKERERDEQTLLLPARCCRVLQVLRQSCCSLPSSPGSLFLWFLVSSQKRKISGRWKILATNPICHRQRPVPQGRQRTTYGFPHQAILWEWLKWPQRQTPEEEVFLFFVFFCFGFVFFLISGISFSPPHLYKAFVQNKVSIWVSLETQGSQWTSGAQLHPKPRICHLSLAWSGPPGISSHPAFTSSAQIASYM